MLKFPAITVSICNLRPASRGTVRIKSADPKQQLAIASYYLSTEEGQLVIIDSLQLVRRLMKQPALTRFRPEEYRPGPEVADDAGLRDAAEDLGTTIFHLVGIAKRGIDSNALAVVDGRLRVRGNKEKQGIARRRCVRDTDDHVRQH